MNSDNNKNKNDLFARIPSVAKFKKTILLTILLIGSIVALIIISYLPADSVQNKNEDVLETEAENTRWVTSNTINKPQTNEIDAKQLSQKRLADSQSTNQLVIQKSQEEQLKEALENINKTKDETCDLSPQQKENLANNASITVSINNFENKTTENTGIISALPQSSNKLSVGSVIPIIFLTEVNSELSGNVLVQVTRNIYSSNRILAVPQGTKILLQYSTSSIDSERLAFKATSLVLPNGKTIPINDFPVLDVIGISGLIDKNNHHYVRNFFCMVGSIASNQASIVASTQIPYFENLEKINPLGFSNSPRYLPQKSTTFYIRSGFEGNLLVTQDLLIPY